MNKKYIILVFIIIVIIFIAIFRFSDKGIKMENSSNKNDSIIEDIYISADGYTEDVNNIYYEGNVIYKKTGNQNPLKDASKYLLTTTPKGEEAINYIVNTYYDLTQYYGNYSEFNILKNEDPEIFFKKYFQEITRSKFDLLEFVPFRLAFVATNSPAFKVDFSKPIGPGNGGGVVGKKYIDDKTILVYGYGGSQAYMGPSGNLCKESGIFIDKFIFKKIDSDWKIWQIENNIDSWTTNNEGTTEEECKEINQDKIEKYKNPQ